MTATVRGLSCRVVALGVAMRQAWRVVAPVRQAGARESAATRAAGYGHARRIGRRCHREERPLPVAYGALPQPCVDPSR